MKYHEVKIIDANALVSEIDRLKPCEPYEYATGFYDAIGCITEIIDDMHPIELTATVYERSVDSDETD